MKGFLKKHPKISLLISILAVGLGLAVVYNPSKFSPFGLKDEYKQNGVTLKRIEHLNPFIPVSTIAWSHDGRHITSSGILRTGEVVWDTKTWQPIMTAHRKFAGVGGVGFSPDGRYLITSESPQGTPENNLFATIWDIQSEKAVKDLKGPFSDVFADNLKFVLPVPGTNYMIFGIGMKSPNELHVVDSTNWEFVRSFGEQYKTAISITVHPSNQSLAVGHFKGLNKGGSVSVWDYSTGQKRDNFEAHKGNVTAISYSRDGKYLVTGGDNAYQVRDKQTGQPKWVPDDLIRVWDARTLQNVRAYPIDTTGTLVRAISVRADNRLIAAGIGFDLYILDAQSNRILLVQRMPFIVSDVVFAPDANVLAVGGGTNLVVWSVEFK